MINKSIKSRYSITNVNSNYYSNIVTKSYVDNQIIDTKKSLRLKKLCIIMGIKKTKEYIGPGLVFAPYIMVQNLDSKTIRIINQRQRKDKIKELFNDV